MTEQPATPKSPHPQKRPFNLILLMSLLALAGIGGYLTLSHYYPAPDSTQVSSGNEAATKGDPELARFELDAQLRSLQPVTEALEAYYLRHGEWPQRLEQLELSAEELQDYTPLELEPNGRLAFSGSTALGEYQNRRIYLVAQGIPNAAGFSWRCSAPGVPQDYLPEYCGN